MQGLIIYFVSLNNLKGVSKSFFIPRSKFVADKYSINSACEKDSNNSSSLKLFLLYYYYYYLMHMLYYYFHLLLLVKL